MENIRKVQLGHSLSEYSQDPYSDITESTLICQSAISNIFFNTDSHEVEESMKIYPTPIHHNHPFKVLFRKLGDARPEIKPLVDFVRFCKKAYMATKKLKVLIENKDGLFSKDNINKTSEQILNILNEYV